MALLACLAAGCGHATVNPNEVSNATAAASRTPRVTLREPPAGKVMVGCDHAGEPRPDYYEPLQAFTREKLVGDHDRVAIVVPFHPSPAHPYMRRRDVVRRTLADDEVAVGIDPRSGVGEIAIFGAEMSFFYCVYADESSPSPSLEVEMGMAIGP